VFTVGYVVENNPLIIRGLRRSFSTGYTANIALKAPACCISSAFPSFPLFIGKKEGTGCVGCYRKFSAQNVSVAAQLPRA